MSLSVCLYVYMYVYVCVWFRSVITKLLSAGLLSEQVMCDDVIVHVCPRDPRTCGVRYG